MAAFTPTVVAGGENRVLCFFVMEMSTLNTHISVVCVHTVRRITRAS